MTQRTSAGIALYRRAHEGVEVLLVHPGGPYFAAKDLGVWSFPKGEYGEGEDPLTVARRELAEETGVTAEGDFVSLGSSKQASGKVVSLWAVEGDCDAATIRSNTFLMEWPPRSGRRVEYPEVDRADWFAPAMAKEKLNPGQATFVDRLLEHLTPA